MPFPKLDPKTVFSRNLWLDTLRGLAALAVAVHHLNAHTKYTGNWFNELSAYGKHGVEVFFFISGFCVQAAACRAKSTSEFMWQRLWRIYPPYLFSIFVVLGVAVVRKLTVGAIDLEAVSLPRDPTSWLAIFGGMVSPATPVATINWVYWTLSYEITFYLVLGLTLLLKPIRYPLLVLISALTFVPGIEKIPGLFFLSHWSIFALGVGFLEFAAGNVKYGATIIALSIAALLKFPLLVAGIVIATFLSTAFSIYKPQSFLTKQNIFTRAGEISYSFYLFHVPLGVFLFAGVQQKLRMTGHPVDLIYYLVVILFCLGISFLSFKWVEKPAMRIGKRFAELQSRFAIKKEAPVVVPSPNVVDSV